MSSGEIAPGVSVKPDTFYVNVTKNESGISTVDVPTDPEKASPYKNEFRQGATLVPRPYAFVEVLSERGGISHVSTVDKYGEDASKKYRKKEWMVLENEQVPSEFLYEAVLGECIEPFEVTCTKTVLLPIRPDGTGEGYEYVLDQQADKEENSYTIEEREQQNLSDWTDTPLQVAASVEENMLDVYNQIEKDWEKVRGDKFDVNGGSSQRKSVLDNFDYQNKLLNQHPDYEHMVVYNTSGQRPRSAVIDNPGYVIDSKAYYNYTETETEAYYTAAVLNSNYFFNILDELKILSSRDLHTKPFEIPIPEYNPDNQTHVDLANEAIEHKDTTDELERLVEQVLEDSNS